jgi:hypothetical protein
LLVRLGSLAEAERLGPYELARIFASLPDNADLEPDDPAEQLVHELAVTAALAKATTGWVPLMIHEALDAGVALEAVMAAVGQDQQVCEWMWRPWAETQRLLVIAGRPALTQEAFDRVARRFSESETTQHRTDGIEGSDR